MNPYIHIYPINGHVLWLKRDQPLVFASQALASFASDASPRRGLRIAVFKATRSGKHTTKTTENQHFCGKSTMNCHFATFRSKLLVCRRVFQFPQPTGQWSGIRTHLLWKWDGLNSSIYRSMFSATSGTHGHLEFATWRWVEVTQAMAKLYHPLGESTGITIHNHKYPWCCNDI